MPDPTRTHASPPRSGRPLAHPGHVIADERGALWIADTGNHRVVGADRHGAVHTVVGTGRPGTADGRLAEACFAAPRGLALASDGEVLYVADTGAHSVRRIDLAAGAVTTVAGTGAALGPALGPALEPALGPASVPVPGDARPARDTALRSPWALALDEERGCLYITMAGSHQIWRLDLRAGQVRVLAGTGAEALADGAWRTAAFARPSGLALSPDRKRLYVADSARSAIRVLHLDEERVETLVGAAGAGHVDGPPDRARLRHCTGLTLGPAGLVVADTHNHALRGINLRHATVTTVWPGRAEVAHLDQPGAVAFDRVDRAYIVADTGNHRLMRVARDASAATELVLDGLPLPAGETGKS